MTVLIQSIERQGSFLFRLRSYIPVPLLALLAVWVLLNPPGRIVGTSGWLHDCMCIAVGAIGLAVRAWVGGYVPDGTSGRNTRHQAAKTLNTSGPYSIVRHPLYLGNYFLWLGVALFTGSLVIIGLTTAWFAISYERIMAAEERFLANQFGQAFVDWARVTPAIVPRLSLWRTANLPFSFRSAARKEYSAMFGFLAALGLLELVSVIRQSGSIELDTGWQVLLGIGLVAYLVLRMLKRHTRLLHVAGR